MRLFRPSPDSEATTKIAAGALMYSLCWIAQGWLAWQIGGGWMLGAFVGSLAPTGFFALTSRERLDRMRQEARGFFRFLMNRNLRTRLLARRRGILDELTALLRLVPESVPAGKLNQ